MNLRRTRPPASVTSTFCDLEFKNQLRRTARVPHRGRDESDETAPDENQNHRRAYGSLVEEASLAE